MVFDRVRLDAFRVNILVLRLALACEAAVVLKAGGRRWAFMGSWAGLPLPGSLALNASSKATPPFRQGG